MFVRLVGELVTVRVVALVEIFAVGVVVLVSV